MTLKAIAVLTLLIVVFSMNSQANAATGMVTGRVGNLNGNTFVPHAGELVAIQGTSLSAVSANDGSFTITGVPVGVYFTVVAANQGTTNTENSLCGQWRFSLIVPQAGETVQMGDLNWCPDQGHPFLPENQSVPPTCTDGIDNNSNGLVDGADPGCLAPPVVIPNQTTGRVVGRVGNLNGNTFVPHAGELVAIQGTSLSAVSANDGSFTITGVPVGVYLTVVAANQGTTNTENSLCGQWRFSLIVPQAGETVQMGDLNWCPDQRHPFLPENQSVPPTCTDGIDNNSNGLVDGADPGCTAPPIVIPNQTTGTVVGRVGNLSNPSNTFIPHAGTLVAVQATSLSAVSGNDGSFTISGVPSGVYLTLVAANQGTTATQFSLCGQWRFSLIVPQAGEVVQMGDLNWCSDQGHPFLPENQSVPPTCTDGIDNNSNGLVDGADPGCTAVSTTPNGVGGAVDVFTRGPGSARSIGTAWFLLFVIGAGAITLTAGFVVQRRLR